MKLNLGAGDIALEGYCNLDRKNRDEIFPIQFANGEIVADASCDEIRASHVLEHFSHRDIGTVLHHWVSRLKPGGVLKIAVPNLEWIVDRYKEGAPVNLVGYLMGGQTDADDFHKCVFDANELEYAMRSAGLVDIQPWRSDIDDCASRAVSLNLMGKKPKPVPKDFKVSAIISTPRLGFMDNFVCAYQVMPQLGIKWRRMAGAFWGQCLERGMEQAIAEDAPSALLTLDYDSIFTAEHVVSLIRALAEHPEADSVASIQASRHNDLPMQTMELPEGTDPDRVPREIFRRDLTPLKTAHFGLTLIRVSSLAKLKKPWFHAVPDKDGTWGDGRTDEDIQFWKSWRAAGLTLYQANRCAIGHMELMIRWPGQDFQAIHQRPRDFWAEGAPREVWQ